MKKAIIAIVKNTVLLMYIIAISFYAQYSFVADSVYTDNQVCHINDYLPNSSSFFFNQQTENENCIEQINTIPTPVRKTHHYNSYLSSKPIECAQIRTFNTFIAYQAHTVIQFEETDIVFPFHFFL